MQTSLRTVFIYFFIPLYYVFVIKYDAFVVEEGTHMWE